MGEIFCGREIRIHITQNADRFGVRNKSGTLYATCPNCSKLGVEFYGL